MSDVSSVINQDPNLPKPPVELIEHKEKQKQLRTETRYFEQGKPFNEDFND
jgi:hypothetical protein